MFKIVLIRHGESVWNKENRFTGWTDVDLTERGVGEAKKAGEILKKEGFVFDVAFTSVLLRAKKTLEIILDEMGESGIPIFYSWRLNERHYGALQGLNKSETAEKYGEKQVKLWRRSFDVRPPDLEKSDPRYPGNDSLYKNLNEKDLPLAESLKDTIARVLPYWHQEIAPAIKAGKRIIVSASGNSLRALVKYLDDMADETIVALNIPTGVPIIYELDENLKPLKHYYLGDPEEIAKQLAEVEAQGKAKK